MGKGRKKGMQSWGYTGKAERARSFLKAVSEAQWELQAASRRRAGGYRPAGPSQRPASRSARGRAGANFLLQYLSVCAADRLEGRAGNPLMVGTRALRGRQSASMMAAQQGGGEDDRHNVMRYLDEEEDQGVATEGSVPSLVDLCTRQIGHDLPLYVGSYCSSSPRTQNSLDAEEAEEQGRRALVELMGLLPSPCLERIALAASRENNISDETLPLLCHPHVRRLVLVGSFTDRGLDALFPHQAHQRPPSFSWEEEDSSDDAEEDGGSDGDDEPDEACCVTFRGCLELEYLVLSSRSLSPDFLSELAVRVPSVRCLRLYGCFDCCFLSQQEILAEVAACMRGVVELDLRGCQWLTEQGLIRWIEAMANEDGSSRSSNSTPAIKRRLERLVCSPMVATAHAQAVVKRVMPTLDLQAA